MKEKIHPVFNEVEVSCACGAKFPSFSTKKAIRVEICSNCHPFYTGKQKSIAREGQVEKFRQRYKIKEKQ